MSNAKRNILSTLVIIFGLGPLAQQIRAQVPLQDLAAMGGSWECRDNNGIHGISVISTTLLNESGGLKKITSQSLSFRIYQRQGGKETWGYFSANKPDGVVVLNGSHLIVQFPRYDMDVRFDSAKLQWTGSWSLCNPTAVAVLERPRPGEGVRISPLVGDWKGSPDPKKESVSYYSPEATSTLHIRQSSDGKLIGWVDLLDNRISPESTQRYGEEVLFRSAEPSSVAFGIYDSVPVAHAEYRYEGTLSADGMTLTGKWRISGGGVMSVDGGETQIPTLFRRVN